MSEQSSWIQVKKRVRGKWQVPLFIISLVLLTASFFKLHTTPTELSMDQAIVYLDAMIRGGKYERAMMIGDILLTRAGETESHRAAVHLQLARARYNWTLENKDLSEQSGLQIVEHYRQTAIQNISLTATDFFRLGQVLEWLDRNEDALRYYGKAIEQNYVNGMELRKHIIILSRDRLKMGPDHVSEMLDAYITEMDDHRLDLLLWAIEEKLDVLEDIGQLDRAATLLTRNQSRFRDSDLRDRFSYLEAMLLYKDGYFDEAETRLRTIRNRIDHSDLVYAMTGWLLGRVVMSDGTPQRPMEARSFFMDVLKYHPEGPYAVASRIGIAESLALLEQHDESIHNYRIALDDLGALGNSRLVNRDVLRISLGLMAHSLMQDGQIEPALEYALLARSLLNSENIELSSVVLLQVAQLQAHNAEQLESKASSESENPQDSKLILKQARNLFAQAGETYLEIAKINVFNDRQSAQAAWRAAEYYSRAGNSDRAVNLFRQFAKERPQHSLVPRAWMRMGQLLQASARLPEAIEAYQQGYRRFPRTLDGARSLVPLAQSYLALGPENAELAEKTLRIVLEDSEVFTPEASEFSEALFLLGDVLMRRGAFEQAISTLEEALVRYAEYPRIGRIRFLLANAYRQSALKLWEEGENSTVPVEIEQIRNEAGNRFRTSRKLFRALIRDYEMKEPSKLSRLDQAYLRHAYMYEADCYFETQEYRQSLKLYEEAGGLYKDQPTGLAAYVQIINCYIFLGENQEARAALSRAMVLVDAIEDGVFKRSISPETRDDWKRYFQWLEQSEMF